jgi:hypothetical protein
MLKLKKGGHVAGHAPMKSTMPMEESNEKYAASGKSPKKPSIMDRRKAMSGAMLNSKKGGVAKKAMGGMMGAPMGAPAGAGAMMSPAMKRALMMRMMAQRGAAQAPAAPMAGTPAMKKGGKASDTAQDKAMIAKAMKQHDAQEHKGGKGTKLKLATGGVTNGMATGGLTNPMKTGGKVSGAAIDAAETKTTIKGNTGEFAKTKMERKKTDPGYQRYAAGGTIEGNEGKFDKTKVVSGKKDPGYERYATGGVVDGMATGGLTNPMKKGGAAKKHMATGGHVNDTGRAVAMPRKPMSQPVANTMQSGTFKKGGRVAHKAVGGSMPEADDGYDPIIAREAARRNMESETMRRENEATPVMDSVKKLLGIRPNAGAGRGFVNPTMTRKAGGRAC